MWVCHIHTLLCWDVPLNSLRGFIMDDFEFCHFFCIYWNYHMIFIIYFVDVVYHIDLWTLNHFCFSRENPNQSFYYIVECGLKISCWGSLPICKGFLLIVLFFKVSLLDFWPYWLYWESFIPLTFFGIVWGQ